MSKIIKPQEGFQEKFLSSPADIVIGGSAAGVGKTFALLLEFLRNKDVKGFGGTIFRRTSPQIKLEGGLWDTSMQVYSYVGGVPRESSLEWKFPKGSKLKFAHLEYEKNKLDYQGSQIPFIGFDELTHFSETMFFYLLSRNRSTCGVKPYVRATCNPDPDSWVAKIVSWWIDQETGFPIPERDGVLRYFIRYGDNYIWGDSKAEVIKNASSILDEMLAKAQEEADRLKIKNPIKPEDLVKSITFISGSIYQNIELLKVDPGYLANLLSQDEATRRSLLESNWKYIKSDLDIYDYDSFRGMFDNNFRVNTAHKRIVADIAGQGSNKFVVGYFEGRALEDITILAKSNGPEVLRAIKKLAATYKVPNKNILFDADGIGALISDGKDDEGKSTDGFLPGSKSFHGGAKPIKVFDKTQNKNIKENYFNLKTQLIYRSGKACSADKMSVSKKVQNTKYDDKMTVKQRMMFERKAFKKDKVDHDGKLRVLPKDKMKIILQNESPDILDMIFMNEFFEIKVKPRRIETTEEQAKGLNY